MCIITIKACSSAITATFKIQNNPIIPSDFLHSLFVVRHSLISSLWEPLIWFSPPCSCAFSRMPYKWRHTVGRFWVWILSLSRCIWDSSMSVGVFGACSFIAENFHMLRMYHSYLYSSGGTKASINILKLKSSMWAATLLPAVSWLLK